jgi:hypothetical protein
MSSKFLRWHVHKDHPHPASVGCPFFVIRRIAIAFGQRE